MCTLVFVVVPAHCGSICCGHSLSARTGRKYLTWSGDVDDLTRPNNTFFVPAEERLDGVHELPASMKAGCANENDVFKCFNASELSGMVKWAADPRRSGHDAYFRVPNPSATLADTVHLIISSEKVASVYTTLCHGAGLAFMCHATWFQDGFSPLLWRVTTNMTTRNQWMTAGSPVRVRLFVVCHQIAPNSSLVEHGMKSGCHVLPPGDIVFPGVATFGPDDHFHV